MQGNTTEIDERNLLRLDALLSHGYGLSPQLVMRSKGLSIEAKALYGYLSSFAGAGDTAFPSTSRILEELDISKNRFYKIRKELVSWGFISIETTATSAGLRTVYTLPQNPIAIKTEIDEIANRRNEIKSSLVANLHNEDMVSHKGDSESERLQQSAGNEPCRQSEAKAQNRGSNLKPCLQSEDEGCLQSGDKLYIDTNINPKVSIDRSAAHPSDDEGPSDWKVTEGMTDPTQRDDGESERNANRRDALDAVPDGTYDPLPTVADGYTLSNSEFEAFNHLCSLSIKTVRGAVRNEAAKQYAKRLGEGYSPATIEKAYIDYAEAYRQNNPWDLENLPWNLNDFTWKKGILSGCKDIISGLKDELKEADCVVIATDVDPSGEGELLAWEALEKCGWRGPTKRMYFADEAPASVQKAFRERKTLPSMDKDGDYV